MSVLLGIDTGGTYTDAVLLDDEQGVLATAKALTTKHDLSVGIREAVDTVLSAATEKVNMVSLSTTFATNAVVEGQGSPIGLLLIGYDPDTLREVGIHRVASQANTVFLQGGHTGTGQELAPLDMEGAREAIQRLSPRVSAFAVSGFFGVRNPTHELEVRQAIRDLTGLPVTCGHELTTRLNAPRRALTVAMNARLIRLLSDLIQTVRGMLRERGIRAPLMVVKGDGSLMDADMALERPVETILSGPAASVVGACFLAEDEDSFVIDMGGTTTDIAAMHEGRPVLELNGVRVGDWDIMVQAIDVSTTGLGGDSEVLLDHDGKLTVGPRRVIPLSLLAERDTGVLDVLRRQTDSPAYKERGPHDRDLGRFVLRQRDLGGKAMTLSSGQKEVWDLVGEGPVTVMDLLSRVKIPPLCRRYLEELMQRGFVVMSAFTPTDAVHVLGRYRCWSVEAAELGAVLWARRFDESAESISRRVVQQVEVQAGRAIMSCALAVEGYASVGTRKGLGGLLIDRALGADHGGLFKLSLALERPIVAIGAPVSTYLPSVASRMGAALRIPEHASVANAIGTVAGGVAQTARILIRPVDVDRAYQVHLPQGTRRFTELEEAVACAEEAAEESARDLALRAGALSPKVKVERRDKIVQGGGGGTESLYLETEVLATAAGRPRMGTLENAVENKTR